MVCLETNTKKKQNNSFIVRMYYVSSHLKRLDQIWSTFATLLQSYKTHLARTHSIASALDRHNWTLEPFLLQLLSDTVSLSSLFIQVIRGTVCNTVKVYSRSALLCGRLYA